MPSKKHDLIWEAKPHTLAKIAILSDYLIRWFQILGSSGVTQGKDLIYVDGFAGPGEYTNHPQGSPLEALIAAGKARANSKNPWKAGKIHCVFIEANAERFGHLETRLQPFHKLNGVEIHLFHNQFVDGWAKLKKESFFAGAASVFVFIDPFGAKGVPFGTVQDILENSYSEVLINFNAQGVARLLSANHTQTHDDLLDSIFGSDEWRTISKTLPFYELCRQALQIYKKQLLAKVPYVFSFDMKSSANVLSYNLVFATRHPRGSEKMKDAMQKIDQDGSYRFTDTSVGQIPMFSDDDVCVYADQMFQLFKGQSASYSDLNRFALNDRHWYIVS